MGLDFEVVSFFNDRITIKFYWSTLGELFNITPFKACCKVGYHFTINDVIVLDDPFEKSMLVTGDHLEQILGLLMQLLNEENVE